MADGVLLDTSFLVAFVSPLQPNHNAAVSYYRQFIEDGIPMFLSSIVISEFELQQRITDLPLNNFIVLPFNLRDGIKSAELDFRRLKGDQGVKRDALKDDVKLLGQCKTQDIAFVITDDGATLYKYCERLRQEGALSTRGIKLEDGFNPAYLDPFKSFLKEIGGPDLPGLGQ